MISPQRNNEVPTGVVEIHCENGKYQIAEIANAKRARAESRRVANGASPRPVESQPSDTGSVSVISSPVVSMKQAGFGAERPQMVAAHSKSQAH